ncbi:Wall-associated receptor kinase, galacturonan-binding domain [Dillenia turbinata]|uniref:Wall-associated receptor kinase, galacturonan-binding domain n=1 Tax=Dillenia turbinata TaxID=194707 RepID=A0AAN8W217_9MAGN
MRQGVAQSPRGMEMGTLLMSIHPTYRHYSDSAAGICVSDVAEAVSTSRGALRGAKVPETEFTTLNHYKFSFFNKALHLKKLATYPTTTFGAPKFLETHPQFIYGKKRNKEHIKSSCCFIEDMLISHMSSVSQAEMYYDLKVGGGAEAVKGSRVAVCHCSSSQRICPNCGSMEVPYPLSTGRDCGDPKYSLRCDALSQKLYFDALNGSSYVVLRIMASSQRMVLQASPWLSDTCVTQDMRVSEGIRLNQTLPFNITSSNTVFLFNCSPRLFLSPLNCTPSSLCHRYLESSGHVEPQRARQCASELNPCCTFVAGGMPSAYKIRLHTSGCQAFRSIVHLDPSKSANLWEEGLEIQWAPPAEPVCQTQFECSGASMCKTTGGNGGFHCLCNRGYHWNNSLGTCLKSRKRSPKTSLSIKVSVSVVSFFVLALALAAATVRNAGSFSSQAKQREKMLKISKNGKSARIFGLKELKKATNGFSKDRILGSGGFGEVYRVVDQNLVDEKPSAQVMTSIKLFADIALACLREKKDDRPAMKDLVREIQKIIDVASQEQLSNDLSLE